jgi:hypothetical protein
LIVLKPLNSESEPNVPDSPYKEAVEIYKMEYEKAAQRYNDLYDSAWTNFSYMALVAGGLLTFGGARFVTPLTALLACLPLLFWWIATFEPLNRYGDMVQKELGEIEKALNALCISKDFPKEAQKGLTHFQNFASREQDRSKTRIITKHAFTLAIFLPLLLFSMNTFLKNDNPPLAKTATIVVVIVVLSLVMQLTARSHKKIAIGMRETRRVRNRVRIAALVLLITSICFGYRVWRLASAEHSLTVPTKASGAVSGG